MRSKNLFLKPRTHGRWWILGLLLVGLYLVMRPSERARDNLPWQPPIEPSGVTIGESRNTSSPTDTMASATPAAKEPTPPAQPSVTADAVASENQVDARAQLRQTIETWSRAWSARDVNAYLSTYAQSFMPAGGQDRSVWEQTRRQRILSKRTITHEVRDLQITLEGNKATARFEQTYTADHLHSVGPKTLQLEFNGSKWLIVSESTS